MNNTGKIAILGVVYFILIFGALMFDNPCYDRSSYQSRDDIFYSKDSLEDSPYLVGYNQEAEDCEKKKIIETLIQDWS